MFMKRILSFMLAAALGTVALAQEPQEARLLRFPATNGREVVFTYAGDLSGMKSSPGTPRTARPSPLRASMTGTVRFIPSRQRAVSRSA